ncbi:MAG: DUF3047 domain-containing protein [Burkholderiaceae bacterium]
MLRTFVTVALGWVAASLASVALAQGTTLTPFAKGESAPNAPWKFIGLPGQTKPVTKFSLVDLDGKRALKVEADLSYGNLAHAVRADPGTQLAWQWRVEKFVDAADLREKTGDDTAVKVCVFFDMPLDKVPFGDRQLLKLARSRTSDVLPTATVCYVWDNKLPVGTTLDNAFTRRMRYMVLRTGTVGADKWTAQKRDVGADFLKLFGDESTEIPAISGIAVGADSDNTQSHSVSYVADLVLSR